MKKLMWGCVLAAAAILLLPPLSVFAISNPDSVSIGQVYVFSGVLEEGDQLHFVRYDVSYNSTPTEDASDTWQVALYDSGDVLQAVRPLNYYQHNIISIYLTPSQALSVGGAHKIRIMGSPTVFGNLTEGVNMRTTTYSSGNYHDADLLGGYIITEAGVLETDWGLTLLTTSDKLNSTGATFFTEAIPGLNVMDPTVFQTATRVVLPSDPNWVATYPEDLRSRGGANLREAISGTMSIFGVEDEFWGSAWIAGILFMLVAAPVYATTRQPVWAMVVGFPVMLLFVWLGAGTALLLYWLLVIVLVLAVIFALTFILRNFG